MSSSLPESSLLVALSRKLAHPFRRRKRPIPHTALLLVVYALQEDQQLATLASLCRLSRSTYHLLTPLLYRDVRLMASGREGFFSDFAYGRGSPFYIGNFTASATPRHRKDPYSLLTNTPLRRALAFSYISTLTLVSDSERTFDHSNHLRSAYDSDFALPLLHTVILTPRFLCNFHYTVTRDYTQPATPIETYSYDRQPVSPPMPLLFVALAWRARVERLVIQLWLYREDCRCAWDYCRCDWDYRRHSDLVKFQWEPKRFFGPSLKEIVWTNVRTQCVRRGSSGTDLVVCFGHAFNRHCTLEIDCDARVRQIVEILLPDPAWSTINNDDSERRSGRTELHNVGWGTTDQPEGRSLDEKIMQQVWAEVDEKQGREVRKNLEKRTSIVSHAFGGGSRWCQESVKCLSMYE